MPTPRFFCTSLPDADKAGRLSDVTLDAQQARHAGKVLRLKTGDAVELFDGTGRVAVGSADMRGREVRVCLDQIEQITPPTPVIEVAVSLPKGPRAQDMVDQLSQLGADRLIPLRCARSVSAPSAGKMQRLTRTAIESAKQSRRATLLAIEAPQTFDQVVHNDADLRLLACLEGATDTAAIQAQLAGAVRVMVMIGPEGGWSDDELTAATSANWLSWRFGPNVMRVETAATTAVGVLRCWRL